MNKKNEDQLTKHIRRTLLDHEEPYVLGSWERFQRQKLGNDRKRSQKRLYAFAASILLMLTFAFAWNEFSMLPGEEYVEESQTESPEQTPTPSNLPQITAEEQTATEEELQEKQTDIGVTENRSTTDNTSNIASQTFPEISPSFSRKTFSNFYKVSSGLNAPPPISQKVAHSLNTLPANNRIASAGENSPSGQPVPIASTMLPASEKDSKNFVFSAAYASVMNVNDSQTDLGMGGGLYTDWNFAKNLSLTSGLFIGQNQLRYKNNQGNQLEENVSRSNNTLMSADNLSYMQLDLINLEIPLNFRYTLTENWSVSAGISSITYLREEYDYVYEQQIQVFDESSATSSETVTRSVTLRSSQTQSEPSFDKLDWAAFYTLSFGYQRKVFKNHNATLEPFIKIPAGKVTSQGVSYTSGGIQLKISF